MSEPKPFASLSSGLLARKGAAKPAMRPQGFGHIGAGLEDLGWNDMGHGPSAVPNAFAYPDEPLEHVPSSIAALTPAPRPTSREPDEEAIDQSEAVQAPAAAVSEAPIFEAPIFEAPAFEPPVFEQQRTLEETFGAESFGDTPEPAPLEPTAPTVPARKREAAPVVVASLPKSPRQAPGVKDKAAFTLRLDRDRHLKLRLACAVTHRSAQQLVSEALEIFLDTLPELEALTGKLSATARKRN